MIRMCGWCGKRISFVRWKCVGKCRTCALDFLGGYGHTYGEGERINVRQLLREWVGRDVG